MFGDVGCSIGDDTWDADYYACLGVDASDATNDAFEGTVGDLYHAAGALSIHAGGLEKGKFAENY